MSRRVSPSKLLYLLIPVILIILGIVFLPKLFNGSGSSSSASADTSNLKAARSSVELNKEFAFPVSKDDKSKTIKFTIQNAKLIDEIVVKGQKATAVAGRTFLILDLKIVNDMDKNLSMNTRDYIRLSVNKKDSELLAPDIHNDPVEIQAISTKYTRLGFPVNVDDKDFVLQVGEIKGDKEKIEIPFNN